MKTSCRAVARLVETYLDGELEPSQLIQVETHSSACTTCAERVALDRSIRGGVRRRVTSASASTALRQRIEASLAAERSAPHHMNDVAVGPQLIGWRGAVALAAAAAAMGLVANHRAIPRSEADFEASAQPVSASMDTGGFDRMLEEFVDLHARPLPPEITNASDLLGFEPYVGVPVNPPKFSPFGAHLVGGRILPIDEKRTAVLQYTMQSGHRISVYVYPSRVSVQPSILHRRLVGSEPVYVGKVKGYSVAAAEHQGIGYAVASDLDADESAELALTAASR
jgi:mycothiol system anti-sigma-R factor